MINFKKSPTNLKNQITSVVIANQNYSNSSQSYNIDVIKVLKYHFNHVGKHF